MNTTTEEKKELTINQILFFWEHFVNIEPILIQYINNDEIKKSLLLLYQISNEINMDMSFIIIKKKRNFLKLYERKNNIEIIISPLLNKLNLLEFSSKLDRLCHFKPDTKLNIIKYKPCDISTLIKLKINNISVDNINYHLDLISDKKHKQIFFNLYLFITNNILFEVTKIKTEQLDCYSHKHKKKSHINVECLVPKNNVLSSFLIYAMGYYNLLYRTNDIIIYSEDKHKDIIRKPLFELNDEINEYLKYLDKHYHICNRCRYSNINTNLTICKCKKKILL